MHQSGLLQHAEHILDVDRSERVAGRERELERRALHVLHENVQVVGVDERVLGRGIEEIRRMPHDELVDRRARSNQHRGRSRRSTAGAARALPGGGDRTRVAREHGDVERADVDAELERVGRDDAADHPFAQPAFDLATAQRQVAAAIAADLLGHARHVLEVLLEIGRQDLGRETALREDDDLQPAAEELAGHAARFGEVRAADAELAIHDRRIDEDEELLAARGAALGDVRERPLRQPLGQLPRIGNRRRRADELRIRTVVTGDAPEPPEHVAQMTAEHAAIGVQLVDHDVAQVLEQLRPARMMRQDARRGACPDC